MIRFLVFLTTLLIASPAIAASTSAPKELRDLYFGETLYDAFQGKWFDAIARLDTELVQHQRLDQPELGSLFHHIDQAEFAVGDFELAYRMHQRAGRAITAVIEGSVEETVRNEAIYRLARIYFQKDQPLNARYALERITGEVPEHIRDDLEFLRAQVRLANGRFSGAATILEGLLEDGRLKGFSGYNLGIALMKDGRMEVGRRHLDLAGRIDAAKPLTRAIRDKANLVLGDSLLADDDFAGAKDVLDRVRLNGPFSNRALLGSGWADASRGRYERALVPWSILVEREVTDPAVQEAMLAAPYAYGKLGVHARAAVMYGTALEAFGAQIDKLDASIASIREGNFLSALVREELKQDTDWVVRLRELPDTPETGYLLDLMASHDFQESLKNYLDLEHLRGKLAAWKADLDAFEDLIEKRRMYYQPLLPAIDSEFRELDSQMRLRLEQRDRIEERLEAMLVAPRPDYLATRQERLALERLARLEKGLAEGGAGVSDEFRKRIERLRGVLEWDIYTDYDRRLTEAHENLRDLNHAIERLNTRYSAFVRTRQAARQSYQGYDDVIRRLRNRIAAGRDEVETLMARQGHVLEVMAVKELTRRRERLEEFQVKARFAMADSYDRAVRAEGGKKVKP